MLEWCVPVWDFEGLGFFLPGYQQNLCLATDDHCHVFTEPFLRSSFPKELVYILTAHFCTYECVITKSF